MGDIVVAAECVAEQRGETRCAVRAGDHVTRRGGRRSVTSHMTVAVASPTLPDRSNPRAWPGAQSRNLHAAVSARVARRAASPQSRATWHRLDLPLTRGANRRVAREEDARLGAAGAEQAEVV